MLIFKKSILAACKLDCRTPKSLRHTTETRNISKIFNSVFLPWKTIQSTKEYIRVYDPFDKNMILVALQTIESPISLKVRKLT